MKEKKLSNQVHFISLGCARNIVDSEIMLSFLTQNNYIISTNLKQADVIIVNTCGFLQKAREEGIAILKKIFQKKKPSSKIIVTGCMIPLHIKKLQQLFPKIHYYLGPGDIDKIIFAIQEKKPGQIISFKKSFLEKKPRTLLSTPPHYAYLKISEGCSKFCSYCLIPQIKGPLKSKSQKQVLIEFRSLLKNGVKEIILVAQDLSDYGKDRKEKNALTSLLKTLLKEKGNFWLRLLYLYPDDINEDFLQLMKTDTRLCSYLDIPLQHINTSILKSMGRKTKKEKILQTIEKIRFHIPNCVIRTTFIVGFPKEGEKEFQELLDFIRQARLDHVGVFPFSPEKNTLAATFPHQISKKIREKRAALLMKEQLKIVKEKNKKMIGQRLLCVIDRYHPDSKFLLQGRHQGQCPEVDSSIILNKFDKVHSFGERHEVKITGFSEHDLIGTVLSFSLKIPKINC